MIPDAVDRAIERAITAGRTAWPALEARPEWLREQILHVVDGRDDPVTVIDGLCHADLYLAVACLHRVADAARHFETRYRSVVESAVAKMDQGRGLRDEVAQVVLDIALVGTGRDGPALAEYSGRGDLRSWVRVIAVREAYRILRAEKGRVGIDDEEMFDVLAPRGQDPEMDRLKDEYRDHFRAAFRESVAALPRRERVALRLQVLDGLSIDEIAPHLQAHRATAARVLARARESLLKDTRRALRKRLSMNDAEVDSVIRLIQSRLDLSLDTVLLSKVAAETDGE